MNGTVEVKNQSPLKIETRFGGAQAAQYSALSVALPVNTLIHSNFEDLEIGKITINAISRDGDKSATLERIAVDRTRVKAGETVEVQAYARTDRVKCSFRKFRSRFRRTRQTARIRF